MITYSETDVTEDIEDSDDHRTPLPCEARTFELTGLALPLVRSRFTFEEVLTAAAGAGDYRLTRGVQRLGVLEKRLIEHVRTIYRRIRSDCFRYCWVGYSRSRFSWRPISSPSRLGWLPISYGGRIVDAMLADEGGYVHSEGDTNWWIPSGHMFYSPVTGHSAAQELFHARTHFFQPHRFRDPFHTNLISTEAIVTS